MIFVWKWGALYPLLGNREIFTVPPHCLGNGEVSSPGPDPVPVPFPVPDPDPISDPVPVPDPDFFPADPVPV